MNKSELYLWQKEEIKKGEKERNAIIKNLKKRKKLYSFYRFHSDKNVFLYINFPSLAFGMNINKFKNINKYEDGDLIKIEGEFYFDWDEKDEFGWLLFPQAKKITKITNISLKKRQKII